MKTLLFIIMVGVMIPTLHAETLVPGGEVSGCWSLDGSPYIVQGEVIVAPGDTLTIAPGVQVRFTGNYKFRVQGRLVAQGTQTDSILFTRHYPTEESRWRGLRFEQADSTSILEYCRIEWSYKTSDLYLEVLGGGVFIDGTMNVRHCRINDNSTHNQYHNGGGGGIFFYFYSTGIVEYCHVVGNEADGDGGIVVCGHGPVIIRYNVIEENSALSTGGVNIASLTSATIHDNVIRYNHSTLSIWGGGIRLHAVNTVDVHHNLIYGNTTKSRGGGIRISYNNQVRVPYIWNNTVIGNHADSAGGGVYVDNEGWFDPPLFINNILWGNTSPMGPQIQLTEGPATVVYCDVEGGWPGVGNLNAYPAFVNPDSGDYHLLAYSQCIDAGNPLSPFDPDSTIADMGAFYYDQSIQGVESPPAVVPAMYALHPAHPNPFNPATIIRFDLPQAGRVKLEVFDVTGRLVRTLGTGARHASPLPAGETWYPAGTHAVTFDGSGLASGVYLVRLEAGSFVQTRKIILLK
ncbi:MAG: T9SS C-terminal target domain-containing protein [Candidatus Zixiibacteriota bacterium]|nr:MAG: T9SS C-terminal target domain-containing protein [candidate division Zixibacteria bacterium]